MFTALAIARLQQNETEFSIRKVFRTQRHLQGVTIAVAGQQITARPQLSNDARVITNALGIRRRLGH